MLLRAGSVRVVVAVLIAAVGACTVYSENKPYDGPDGSPGGADGTPSTGGTSGTATGGTGGLILDPTPNASGQAGCDGSGDCAPDPEEACDDGNIDSGDGCTATCAQIEADYACPTAGKPCVSNVKCGDKKVGG